MWQLKWKAAFWALVSYMTCHALNEQHTSHRHAKKKNSFASRRAILDRIWAACVGSKISVLVHVIKAYREVEVKLHTFLTLALDGSEWWTAVPGRLKAWKELRVPWIRRWVGPRGGLSVLEEIRKTCSWTETNPQHSSPHPSHYIDWATLATTDMNRKLLSKEKINFGSIR